MVCVTNNKPKKKKTFHVVAGILIKDGKLLCGKRGQGYFESLWEFPGGKIEAGETKQEALKRELLEEIGCSISDGEFYATTMVNYEDFSIVLDTYVVKHFDGEPKANVHQEIGWKTLTELNKYNWCDPDSLVIEKIISEGGIKLH